MPEAAELDQKAGICTRTAPGQMSRERVVREAPESVKECLKRAFSKDGSRANAIKAMCLVCVGYDRKEVKNCSAKHCPLWAYRPFQE